VVHRDVKADNVFLTADGRAVIGDWGEGMLLYTGGLSVAVDHTLQGLVRLQSTEIDAPPSSGAAEGVTSASQLEEDPAAYLEHKSMSMSVSAPVSMEAGVADGGSPLIGSAFESDELFLGSGSTASADAISRETLSRGGAGSARAPEIAMRMLDSECTDAWGRRMVTAAQVYASSDAWAAARMMWEILAQQAKAAGADLMALPDNTTWYPDGAIPGLPAEAGCPEALEAVLRGLLQSRPEDRLPAEVAIPSLIAALYVPLGEGAHPPAAVGSETSETPLPGDDGGWVQKQRIALAEAEHASPPIPLSSLVGTATSAAPALGSSRGGAVMDADSILNAAIIRAAERLCPISSASIGGTTAAGKSSEMAVAVESLSMGGIGAHAF